METVINNSTPQKVQQLSATKSEEVEKARQANAAFVERMRLLAQDDARGKKSS